MEIPKTTDNKNDKNRHKSDEHFMSERTIKDNLEKRILENQKDLAQRLAGKTLVIRSQDRKFEELKDEGDPLPWIEPDEEEKNHNPTAHGKDKHDFTYRHMEPLDTDGEYTCNTLTDKWFEWFLRTPASISAFTNPSESYLDSSLLGGRNAFLFQDRDHFFKDDDEKSVLSVYFAAGAPFQDPSDFRTITMTQKAALLVPVYTMSASRQDHPSLDTDEKLKQLIVEDLSGVIQLRAWFDRIPIEGCCVIRQSRLSIDNIPTDNVIGIPDKILEESRYSIETCHGGYWLLIKREKLTAGDHLLEFMAYSRNYEIAAKILITVLI